MSTDDTQSGQYGRANLLIGWGVTESCYVYMANTTTSAIVAATKKTVTQFLNIDLGFMILIWTLFLRDVLCVLAYACEFPVFTLIPKKSFSSNVSISTASAFSFPEMLCEMTVYSLSNSSNYFLVNYATNSLMFRTKNTSATMSTILYPVNNMAQCI